MTPERRFRLLDARVPADREEWVGLWRGWTGREVWAHPGLAEALANAGERVICMSGSSEEGGILLPLIVKPLSALEWADPLEAGVDLTSPYGYGGPFRWGQFAEDAFWDQFETWAREIGAVTCFTRLSLFPDGRPPFRGEVREVAPNVVVDLRGGADSLWRGYEHKVRKNVNRAVREGVQLEVDPEGRRLDDFLEIYGETMQRREAGESYRFGRAFFEDLMRELDGCVTWFHAIWQGRVVSTELVLHSATRMYSFLGGTREEAFSVRPNDFLKHEMICWGQSSGRTDYVLGGGFEPGDGIFMYKKAFAPDGVLPFLVGTRILDAQTYGRLVRRREDWARERSESWRARPGFFPEYRS